MRPCSLSHHVFHSTDELVVEEQVLGLVFGVGSRVEHPAHAAGHRSEVFLPGVLRQTERDVSSRPSTPTRLTQGRLRASTSLTMMVWLPSLSASLSFLTSFCRHASESGVAPSCALTPLQGHRHTLDLFCVVDVVCVYGFFFFPGP